MEKAMRIAEIIPVGCLEKTAQNQYHMCLAHLVQQNDEYTKFYRRMSNEGKYVLMDNGAAEGSQLDIEGLIECYEKVQPTEIVLPDTLCNSEETVQKSVRALQLLKDRGLLKNRRVMFVPQGKTFREWCNCLQTFMAYACTSVDTIGVSKFLEMETGDSDVRMKAVRYLDEHCKWYEIHLLGCSEGPDAIKECHELSTHVRGCDSAFAYICTQAGVTIGPDTKRPSGEIDFLNGPDYDGLEQNMKSFEVAIGVSDNTVTESWR